jgi:two-component system phosphate regulon sensor histidine kinase PhoR
VKRETLRFVLVLAIFCISGIIFIQIYWFSRAFNIREKQFNQTVNIALRNVADQMLIYNNRAIPKINPVEQLSSNYFVVMLNDQIDAQLLETFLINEFQRIALATDFEYAIYDCVSANMVFGNNISMDASGKAKSPGIHNLPIWKGNDYYFGVLFPNKDNTLIGQMGIWIFSSLVLLLVVVFFGYALFVIFRQRRFTETQKLFINNMMHEFRTPISTIQLSSAVLQNPEIMIDPKRLTNYAKIIKEESNRLLSQVENVLQVAIIEEKKIGLKMEIQDAHQLIKEVVGTIELAFHSSPIQIQFDATQTKIRADKIHFSNLIKNLIDNAIKYSEGAPHVIISTRNHKKTIIIEVSDNGIGISKEHQKRVFSKFYRVPTGNLHNVKGFGLGLHYVKNMVKLHKGHISLDSTPGTGSTFTLIFPIENHG